MKDTMDHFRAIIFSRYPLFSKYLADLECVPTDEIETLDTNGKEIRYNPEFFNASMWSNLDREFFILHELAHVFLMHHIRYNPDIHTDEKRAQAAMDYAANDFLKSCDVHIWRNALINYQFTDKSWEEIYRLLYDPQNQSMKQQHPMLHGKVQPHPDTQQESDDPIDNTPESKSRLGKSKRKELEKEAQQQRDQAIQYARQQGGVPAGLERIIEKYIESTFDYRVLLAEMMEKIHGMDDYTYSRPNVTFDNDEGIIFPDMESEEAPCIVFVGDTSASISKQELAEIAGESVKIMETVEPEELVLLWCDTQVKNPQVYTQYDVIEPKPVGGGGTSFIPPFEWVQQEHKEPIALIYLTDGYCHSYPPEPPYPTIWLIKGDNSSFQPPFGEVIYMGN